MKNTYECPQCGRVFESYGNRIYCSRSCVAKKYYSRLAFNIDDLSEHEKFERLKKSFYQKVIIKDGCWDWKLSEGPGGYLNIRYKRRKIMAHRASWIIHKGEIPNNLWVLHSCDNRRCTNPDHLFLGTPKDNAVDRQQKNRGQKGITHHKCKLSEKDVLEIKNLLSSGLSCEKISKKFSVTNGTIWFIKHGITWKHLGA